MKPTVDYRIQYNFGKGWINFDDLRMSLKDAQKAIAASKATLRSMANGQKVKLPTYRLIKRTITVTEEEVK